MQKYFNEYARYHQSYANQLTHVFGIPLVLVSILGILARFQFSIFRIQLDAGFVAAMVLCLTYFVWAKFRLAVLAMIAVSMMYGVGKSLPASTLSLAFVAGWMLQFVGHGVYEKRSPAFFRNLEHLLVGPIWILAKFVRRTS